MKITNLIYIVLASFLFISSLSAQKPKWVSTEVQSRVAVLEHFTDMNHNYSARGDAAANQSASYYKDKFIIINEHCNLISTSITPRTLDLTTDEGNTIFSNAGLYIDTMDIETAPCALNRVPHYIEKIWAMDYIHFSRIQSLNNFVNEPSIVNVYVKPEINFETRVLTVEVEYYYTNKSRASENFLTVMLLQNEIIGKQDGGKNFNPNYVTDNGLYRHMHVLRKIISDGGVWGDTISNTKKGSYGYVSYTLLLPESIKNVPLDLTNLEVVAFISESKGNIYTGHKAVIEAPDDIKTDLEVEDETVFYDTYKFETISPKVKVTNKFDIPVTKFDVEYIIANSRNTGDYYKDYKSELDVKKYDPYIVKKTTYSGLLQKDQSVIVEFPEITQSDFNTSSFYITQANVSNIYNDETVLFDIDTTNNTINTAAKIGLIDTVFSETEITFENPDTSSNTGFIPAYAVLDKSIIPYIYLVHKDTDFLTSNFSGAKNTKAALLFYLSNKFNSLVFKPGYIMFGKIDCHDNPNKILSYYYAYSDGEKHGTSPRIIVEISKDWGKTWKRISEAFCEETGVKKDFETIYVPTSEEYKHVQVNLSGYGKENFIIRVGCLPGTNGEVLFLDEIS
ncbi:MAG: Omp28-related outer membrane protein, partial [Bacteroidetes bacterium]|nr:Omp28-related outer membrane protein [Bacteroidota bacterium]